MKQKISDEDDRIRRAIEEREAKRMEEEKAKEEKLLKDIKEQAEHRNKQVRISLNIFPYLFVSLLKVVANFHTNSIL